MDIRSLRPGSVVGNSLYLIATTIVTSLLGYLFWVVAARMLPSAEVGLVSGLISATIACSLFTHLGPGMWLIEQLPRREHTPAWGRLVGSALVYTSLVTVLTLAVILAVARLLGSEIAASIDAEIAVCLLLGAFGQTATSVSGFVFISATRSRFHPLLNGAVSAAKLLLLLGAALVTSTPESLLWTWALSNLGGTVLAVAVLLPRLRSYRLSVGRPAWRTTTVRRIAGHHVTSSAGALLPYLLPVLVLARLGPQQNAYFYTTWMVAGAVFMVGPSVASSLFSAGVRDHDNLARATAASLRFCALLLPACVLGSAVFGRDVLSIFGAGYARQGYGLLLVLVAAAIPDAFSSIAVGALRAAGNVGGAMRLNLLISSVALTAAWLLAGRLGILGVGLGWMTGQVAGSVAAAPWMTTLMRRPRPLSRR